MLKSEEVNLKAFEIDLGTLTPIQPEVQEPLAIEKSLRKRKNFDELTSKVSKRARVKSVIEILQQDQGLEEKVLEKLEVRKMTEKSEEDFDRHVWPL